jgi:hypothetical protein
MKSMYKNFGLTDEEFGLLQTEFGDLAKFQGWQLLRKNLHNNHTDDLEDIEQELLIAVIKAGVYYKRQVYIEDSLKLAKRYATDDFVKELVEELNSLWTQRTKHGANKQKFGDQQEKLLERIICQVVPCDKRPNPKRSLVIDKKFSTYCKQITWNQQKSLGRKITRERSIRNGLTSLSEFGHLDNCEKVNW